MNETMDRVNTILKNTIDRIKDAIYTDHSQDVSSYGEDITGVPITIWATQKGSRKYSPRVRITPPEEKTLSKLSPAITIDPADPEVIGDSKELRKFEDEHIDMARNYVKLNREPLMKLWNGEYDFEDYKNIMTTRTSALYVKGKSSL